MSEASIKEQLSISGIDASAIRSQLARIVESPPFRNSKRYPRFLRFIVEETLKGNADGLKERVLGIEVFDKPPDYDVAEDPIVRVAAGEIRKRIAQYYVEIGHEGELRIDLPPGAYVPQFHYPAAHRAAGEPDFHLPVLPLADAAVLSPAVPVLSGRETTGRRTRRILPLAALGLALAAAIAIPAYFAGRPGLVDRFWQPVLSSSTPPMICVADLAYFMKPDSNSDSSSLKYALATKNHLALADVVALAHVAGILEPRGKKISLLISSSATFTDLRQHPTILIGGMDNQWTIRLTKSLRYRIVQTENPNIIGIVDGSTTSPPQWVVDYTTPYNQVQKEFAIVARFKDPTTNQPALVIAGVGPEGTIAAGEFVSDPSYLAEFAGKAPRGWENKNVEIVLETDVIDGKSGPPHIIATHTW